MMTAISAPPVHLGAVAKQPATAVVGYGFGDFAMNLSFSMSTSFLLYYFTDVAGLSAAAVGTMFLVVRLWDAFTDLFAGRVVDKVMTRWGKFRPFILWFAVPVLFLSFLNFNIPTPGIKWLGIFEVNPDTNAQLLYAYLAYAVLGLVYSLINIPYGSLASAMTQSVNERAKLVAGRAFGAAIGGVLLTYIVAPQISAIQKTAPKLAPNADAAAKAAYDAAVLVYRQNVQSVFTTDHPAVHPGRLDRLLPHLPVVPRGGRPHDPPKVTIKETIDDAQAQQAAGLPVRGELLLPDRPVRGRRLHGLLRQVRARRHLADRHHDPGELRHRAADHPDHPAGSSARSARRTSSSGAACSPSSAASPCSSSRPARWPSPWSSWPSRASAPR